MSVCSFIASDFPLSEFAPSQNYPLEINIDTGTVYDGGADDNYFLLPFSDVGSYTDKSYGVSLEWHYTEGRAKQIIEYIKTALSQSDNVEFWHVWLMGYYEFEERPFIHRKAVSFSELTPELIKEIDDADIWNTPDKAYPERPSFYCLTITR
ncbi:MAG: hypothetical protein IKT47_08610 [Oscillospiraceae bacterium]|nr:hypothetical protein [Oscillospiraceae bacterium]